MFIIRNATLNDLSELYELSKLMLFINLPSNPKTLEQKVKHSLKSFENPKENPEKNEFIFILEDTTVNKLIGVSIIHGKHGNDNEPHFFLTVGQENKYSESLNTGFVHGTLKFGFTTDGYTEIGGLILEPSYRAHELKLGKALSFARFLYIGMNKKLFTDTIHVELMPPFDENGNSPLWEAIGRKFLNIGYHDADMLSRKNKEFILSLYPRDTIYESLLPLDARDAIGKVGNDTLPVKRMLESIGFKYTKEVDPFDGGPHFRAKQSEITPIKETKKINVEFNDKIKNDNMITMLPSKEYFFYSIVAKGKITANKVAFDKRFKSNFDQNSTYAIKY